MEDPFSPSCADDDRSAPQQRGVGNRNVRRAAQLHDHFAVSRQIQNLRCTCARRMKASGQEWQEGSCGALIDLSRQAGKGDDAWHFAVWPIVFEDLSACSQ